MTNIVKNLAAVKDAPISTHTLTHISLLLAAAENRNRPLIVAHRHTGEAYSTTVYDVIAHRLYRAMHPCSVRSWLVAITKERANVRFLGNSEILHLQVVEDKRVTAPTFV
jgi:hypothetical protein